MMVPFSIKHTLLQLNYTNEWMLCIEGKNRRIVGGRYFCEYWQLATLPFANRVEKSRLRLIQAHVMCL
jgi:hypothetical protein